jgi:tRNA pseudouridine55 synthase
MSLFGLLNLNKPSGVTSRRVVDGIQRLVKPAKVGHAGTLDPLAGGVLVVDIGQATRLVEYVQQMPKHYRATFLLGRSSTTEDTEGEITLLPTAAPPSLEQIQQAAAALTGTIEQRPPAYSALKIAGRRAYALARAGQSVELAPRQIEIHRIEILRYEYPELQLDVQCGGGTYIRSLGRDLAELSGTAAVMSALVRTAIGRFMLSRAIDPNTLTRENISQQLLPATLAVRDLMPECVVTEADQRRIANGLPVSIGPIAGNTCAALSTDGRLVAILTRRNEDEFSPDKYFPGD